MTTDSRPPASVRSINQQRYALILAFVDLCWSEKLYGIPKTKFMGWESGEAINELRDYLGRADDEWGLSWLDKNSHIHHTRYWNARAELFLSIVKSNAFYIYSFDACRQLQRIHTCSDDEFLFLQLEMS